MLSEITKMGHGIFFNCINYYIIKKDPSKIWPIILILELMLSKAVIQAQTKADDIWEQNVR